VPSFLVKTNDVVEVKQASKKLQRIRDAANNSSQNKRTPAWLETNPIELKGTVLELPFGDKLKYRSRTT